MKLLVLNVPCLLLEFGRASGKKVRQPKPLSAKLRPGDALNTFLDSPWNDALRRVSQQQPTDACEESTVMLDYLLDLVQEMGFKVFETLNDNGILDAPTYIKALLDSDETDEYIGKNGELTEEHRKYHEKSEEFWNGTDEIKFSLTLLMGMHGDELLSDHFEDVLAEANKGASPEDIASSAKYWREYVDDNIGFDHPLLSFNAFAASWVDTQFDYLADRIVVGDGLLGFFESVGVGAPGRAYVHAHEFAHHVQFDLGVEERFGENTAKESRRIELMADTFAAYHLAHKEGQNLELLPICEVYDAAVAVGDCNSEDEGHHGTPAQRECAAIWGASLTLNGPHIKEILEPGEFVSLFDENLKSILALDQAVCPGKDNACEFLQNGINDQISETAAEVLKGLLEQLNHG